MTRKSARSEMAFLLDSVVGYETTAVKGEVQELAGVVVVDDGTLEIKLNAPWFEFPYVLTHPATAVAAGPYRVESEEGGKVRIVAPKRARVDFLVNPDARQVAREFREGRLDIAEVSDDGPVIAAGIYLGINSERLSDVRFRQAIALAIDRSRISETTGRALTPSANLVPSNLPGSARSGCAPLCRRDLPRARILMKEVFGDAPAPSVTIDFEAGRSEALIKEISRQLGEIGVTVSPRGSDLPAFFATLTSKQHDLYRFGWVADYPLADWFVNPLYRGGSLDNATSFASADIDARLAAARAESQDASRVAQYRAIVADVSPQSLVIPLGHFKSRWSANERIGNFVVDPIGGFDL